jgi:hypothetical protein
VSAGEGGGRERLGGELVRADGPMSARTRLCPHGRMCASARTHVRIRADVHCFTPGNFKKDATVRPGHGRPHGHYQTVRPFVRPSVRKSPCDNPAQERQRGLTPRSGSAEHQCGSVARNRYMLFPLYVFLLYFLAAFLVRLFTNEIALVCPGQGCKFGSN